MASLLAKVFVGCLMVWLAGRVVAQPANYVYDASGNPTGVSVGTSSMPAITTAPQAELIGSNSFAMFSVVATGSGLSYQWLSNGIPIIGATSDSLLIGNLPLTSTNLGSFSVIISNSFGSVTSAPAPLWSDSNGNGIPDWWELYYFHNVNQPALADYDGDGVDNLDEYLEGTDPTNPLSFDPRLYIQIAHGSGIVTVSPDQPYFIMGQLVTLTAIPDAGQGFSGWSGAVTGTKSPISLIMSTNETVTATFGFPLGVALDDTNLVWTTTGDELWFGQADVTEDGVSAAQSGPIVSYWNGGTFVGDQTTLQTTFYSAQPEQLGFWWDVSSDPPDGVSFRSTAIWWRPFRANRYRGNICRPTFPPGSIPLPGPIRRDRWTFPTGFPIPTPPGWVM